MVSIGAAFSARMSGIQWRANSAPEARRAGLEATI